MAILAWRITWIEKPGGLQSMGSPRVGQDCATNTYTEVLTWAVIKCSHSIKPTATITIATTEVSLKEKSAKRSKAQEKEQVSETDPEMI